MFKIVITALKPRFEENEQFSRGILTSSNPYTTLLNFVKCQCQKLANFLYHFVSQSQCSNFMPAKASEPVGLFRLEMALFCSLLHTFSAVQACY